MTGHLPHSPSARKSLLIAGWVLTVGALAALLATSQADSRRGIDERFALRAEIASRFVTTYVDDLVERQRDVAARRLATREVPESLFQRTVADDGFEAAVLVDGRGRLLRVAPPKPDLLGQDMTRSYDHLRRGVQGEVAVSNVVPSAARGIPIVAFAVPYETPYGRRVYSGAYDVSSTPLGAYLRNAVQIKPNRVYLLDDGGNVVASNGRTLEEVRRLSRIDAGLAAALTERPQGSYGSGADTQRYASRRVPGTPWRIVIAIPTETLYSSIGGIGRWLPWLAVVGFALGGLMAIVLLTRLMESRSRLTDANTALERLSRVDPLTGLHNRRHMEEVLEGLVSASRRHPGLGFAVMLIDVDHFKRINDTYGHQDGDVVLGAMSRKIAGMLRAEDALGRWGGEEFLLALPGVDGDGAAAAAERIRAAVSGRPVRLPDGKTVAVTVTVGVAIWDGDPVQELLTRADAALYRGKELGRDRVQVDEGALTGTS